MNNAKIQYLLGNVSRIIETLNEMRSFIIDSYNKHFSQFNDTDIAISWMESILIYIDTIHQQKYNILKKQIKDEISSLNKTKTQNYQKCYGTLPETKEINKSSDNEKLDIFTSKDIQNKNNEIIRDFMQFSTNFIKDEDAKENQTLGTKLFLVANISRCAYNDSNQILYQIYKDFEGEKDKDIIIDSPEQFRKNFSNWVKKPKNWQNSKRYFDNLTNKFNENFVFEEKKSFKNYFIKLYRDLLVLYFLCELSFPSVTVSFHNENEFFDSKTMIDNFQIGKRHKPRVNFVYFPSLYSNGNFLENGKKWVFNFINDEKKRTFFVESNQLSKLTPLIDEKKKFCIPKISDKLRLELVKNISYSPKTNYPISDNINKEYVMYIIDKNTKKTYSTKSKSNFKLKDNEEFIKLELYLFNELILEINNKYI